MLRKPVLLFIALFLYSGIPARAQDQDQQEQPAPQAQTETKQQEPPAVKEPEKIVTPSETAHPPSTARKIFSNFWGDQKAMWTSPFHTKPEDVKWWGLFGGGTAALIAKDRDLSNWVGKDTTQISFSKNVSQIGAAYTTLPLAGGFYLYGKWKNDAKARETGALAAEALLDSYIIVGVLKIAGGRERPDEGTGHFFRGPGHQSFPSGHAIMSWSMASLIAHEYAPGKVAPIVAYSLASVVSVARFTGQKHWASDIVAGGAMGWFIGRYVYEHHLDPNIHKRYNQPVVTRLMPANINPVMDLRTRTYGVALNWNK
jgi:membrane-associated phospholipid phosphatase